MRILHVALGLPPLRTGGLTRYCTELILAQKQYGNEVFLLYPGRYMLGGVRIVKHELYDFDFRVFELVNPLPVALTYGVAEPSAFVAKCTEKNIFREFLIKLQLDTIHVHSFMGIYKEFFEAAKSCGIPMVFTTHDYYPICPRCTFVDSAGLSCEFNSGAESCATCCRGGMTLKKSMIMQSGVYARLKSSNFVKLVGGKVKREMNRENALALGSSSVSVDELRSYHSLLEYNKAIFDLFDITLCNSRKTEGIYRKFFPDARYRLAWISHSGFDQFVDNRRVIRKNERMAVVGYLGGKKEYKGYKLLIEAARHLHEENISFELRLYGDEFEEAEQLPELVSCGRFNPGEIRCILRELDVVVIPSTCHETFGFVALEALCAHVPVICSDYIGASELIPKDAVFPTGDSFALAKALRLGIGGNLSRQEVPVGYPLAMDEQVIMLNGFYKTAIEAVSNDNQ